jgi:hypothetical protein
LQGNGRIPNVDLAEAVSRSPSSCLRRTEALETDCAIAGYRAEIDRELVGLGLTVFISPKVEQHSRETSRRIESALTAIPAVVVLLRRVRRGPISSSSPQSPASPTTSSCCSTRSSPSSRSPTPAAPSPSAPCSAAARCRSTT